MSTKHGGGGDCKEKGLHVDVVRRWKMAQRRADLAQHEIQKVICALQQSRAKVLAQLAGLII